MSKDNIFEIKEKPNKVERAFLVRMTFDKNNSEDEALLKELKELVTTLEVGIVATELAFVRKKNTKWLCGTGKAIELIDLAKSLDCDCIIFDNELSPMQQRAWEKESGITVIDREEVILDIFASRARTQEAQLQVQLARMHYALPRMAKMWTHLDRQGGAGGGAATRGEGEKQIEVDRRIARERIARVREELDKVLVQRKTQRKQRERNALSHAAIVGYTNAGKSTLLNALSQSDIYAEDKLFATLDPTTRKIELPNGQPLLITDTVGFIRNLPHRLVESFKATLEEAVLADFLIHVLDASEPQFEAFYEATRKVLAELDIENKPQLLVLNKIDQISPEEKRAFKTRFPDCVLVSAKNQETLPYLMQSFAHMLEDKVVCEHYLLPHDRGDLLALLYSQGKVLDLQHQSQGAWVSAVVPKDVENKFFSYITKEPKEELDL